MNPHLVLSSFDILEERGGAIDFSDSRKKVLLKTKLFEDIIKYLEFEIENAKKDSGDVSELESELKSIFEQRDVFDKQIEELKAKVDKISDLLEEKDLKKAITGDQRAQLEEEIGEPIEKLCKSLFERGRYEEAYTYLDYADTRSLVVDSKRYLSLKWGKLEISLLSTREFALVNNDIAKAEEFERFAHLKDITDPEKKRSEFERLQQDEYANVECLIADLCNTIEERERVISPMIAHVHRARLWELICFSFIYCERGLLAFVFGTIGKKDDNILISDKKYSNALQTLAPHCLRYISAFSLLLGTRLNSRKYVAPLVGGRIDSESVAEDEICTFMLSAFQDYDFDKAESWVAPMTKSLEYDPILCFVAQDFIFICKNIIVDSWLRLYCKLPISRFSEFYGVSDEQVEEIIEDILGIQGKKPEDKAKYVTFEDGYVLSPVGNVNTYQIQLSSLE
ncbi:Eukaryotic translation initiation factor 3 subunit E like protein [Aduncisulcus paluster]|uniref:Eukaryotic translation initiation factor 3 subunit E like protein n=1 Tax=Aduncisulcus paluster TaxID=2918883 RepID=A0ABQ5K380_9EUKA|nr:Eukaryotic translation initiation factor 3 subunit E like protein [Aduncisulcus paluster]